MTFWSVIPVTLAAVYGGYFGAGLSVIILAVLGLLLNDSLNQLNASKQIIAFAVNIAAAIFFLFSKNVVWPLVFLMAVCSLAGGALGGRLASRIQTCHVASGGGRHRRGGFRDLLCARLSLLERRLSSGSAQHELRPDGNLLGG